MLKICSSNAKLIPNQLNEIFERIFDKNIENYKDILKRVSIIFKVSNLNEIKHLKLKIEGELNDDLFDQIQSIKSLTHLRRLVIKAEKLTFNFSKLLEFIKTSSFTKIKEFSIFEGKSKEYTIDATFDVIELIKTFLESKQYKNLLYFEINKFAFNHQDDFTNILISLRQLPNIYLRSSLFTILNRCIEQFLASNNQLNNNQLKSIMPLFPDYINIKTLLEHPQMYYNYVCIYANDPSFVFDSFYFQRSLLKNNNFDKLRENAFLNHDIITHFCNNLFDPLDETIYIDLVHKFDNEQLKIFILAYLLQVINKKFDTPVIRELEKCSAIKNIEFGIEICNTYNSMVDQGFSIKELGGFSYLLNFLLKLGCKIKINLEGLMKVENYNPTDFRRNMETFDLFSIFDFEDNSFIKHEFLNTVPKTGYQIAKYVVIDLKEETAIQFLEGSIFEKLQYLDTLNIESEPFPSRIVFDNNFFQNICKIKSLNTLNLRYVSEEMVAEKLNDKLLLPIKNLHIFITNIYTNKMINFFNILLKICPRLEFITIKCNQGKKYSYEKPKTKNEMIKDIDPMIFEKFFENLSKIKLKALKLQLFDLVFIYKIQNFIKFLEREERHFLELLEIEFIDFKIEYLELISKSIRLNNLKNLRVLSYHMEESDLLHQKIFTFDRGFINVLQSSTLKAIDWEYFLTKNSYYLSDEFMEAALKMGIFKTVNKLNLKGAKQLTSKGIISILNGIDFMTFDFEFFHKENREEPFFNNKVYIKLFDPKFDVIRSKMSILSYFDQNCFITGTLDLYNSNKLNQRSYMNIIQDIYWESKKKPEIMVELFNDLAAIANILIKNNIMVSLPFLKELKLNPSQLNTLVQAFPYEGLNNIYHWILEDPILINFLDAKSLFIAANGIKNNNFMKTSQNWENLTLDFDLLIPSKQILKSSHIQNYTEIYECENAVLIVFKTFKHLTSLILKGNIITDRFCEQISIILSPHATEIHKLRNIYILDNSVITYVGYKYIYTTIISLQSEGIYRKLLISNQKPIDTPSVCMLNNGLNAGIISKFQQYRQLNREKGLYFYDIYCPLIVLYSIICPIFSLPQFYKPEIEKKPFVKKINEFNGKIMKWFNKNFTFGYRETQYEYFDMIATDGVHREEFYFSKNCVKLNNYLKSSIIWTIYLVNTILYYLICLIFPVLLILPCGQGHSWASHVIYSSYALYIFFFECFMAWKIAKIIDEEEQISLSFNSLTPLVMSQIAKSSIYTDMLYMTLSFKCGNFVGATISAIAISLQIVFNLNQILTTLYDYFKAKNIDYHATKYINLLAKYSYNNDFKAIAEILERFSTSCTTKLNGYYIPEIIIINVFKLFIQNLCHTILQMYSFITSNENESTYLISLLISIVSFILSFYTAITAQPSICNSDMIRSLYFEKYRGYMTEKKQIHKKSFLSRFSHSYNKISVGDIEMESLQDSHDMLVLHAKKN